MGLNEKSGGNALLKTFITAGIIPVLLFAAPAFCESLTYDFNVARPAELPTLPQLDPSPRGAGNDPRCSLGYESKRREIITTYNLSRDSVWKYGVTRNEWGDVKEQFCYLEKGRTVYIYLPFHLIFLSDPPIRVVNR